ncbi:MAG: putative quinol monooxygenase [Pseudomonadota bacterium]
MFAVTVLFTLKPGEREAFLPLMRRQAINSLALEPECRHFDVWTDPARPEEVFLYELYSDAAAFDTHLNSDHFKSFASAVEPMLMDKTVTTWATEEQSDG